MESPPCSGSRVLVVDSAGLDAVPLSRKLTDAGHVADCVRCGPLAFEAFETGAHDTVVLFPCAPGEDGLRLLKRARALQRSTAFIVVGGDGCVETAMQAMRLGAMDYLAQPGCDGDILFLVGRASERANMRREMAQVREQLQTGMRAKIIGQSKALEQVFDLVERAAPTNLSVLVTGETGTGKELVSRAVHDLSPRREKGFVPVSCASVPDQLMESSLFGHVRGAFTGAVSSRKGLFEEANGGTVFLDEVECLKMDLQPKLLRVLQEGMIQRVGGRHDVHVEFRAVAATNADLEEEVDAGAFRADLFYRLNVFPIHIPPLRERPEDIPILATYFRDSFAAEAFLNPLPIPKCCMDIMLEYRWPGNVRELRHVIERALLMSDGGSQIKCSTLKNLTGERVSPSWGRALAENWSLERLQREYAGAVLQKTNGHKRSAARILGIDRRTLYRKLQSWSHDKGFKR